MTNAERFRIEREIKDIKHYLDSIERDKHLYDEGFIHHKKLRLKELEEELRRE